MLEAAKWLPRVLQAALGGLLVHASCVFYSVEATQVAPFAADADFGVELATLLFVDPFEP